MNGKENVRMRDHRSVISCRHWVFSYLLVAGLMPLCGCGKGQLAAYPVTGTVLVDGRPAEGAIVTFVPVEGSEALMKERPYGEVDAQGKFQLMTFVRGDGAPPGDYKVTVLWTAGAKPGQLDRLGGRYSSPDESPLTATVEDAPADLPPFKLSSK
jgi:hypothetical protein